MNKVKIVIPARYGSSRLPGKPLLEISDRPIFWHVFQRCLEAGFDKQAIVIATDDKRIQKKAIELSLPIIMTSSNHESGTDRIFEVARSLKWSSDDIVVNVQGDEPLISSDLIKQLTLFASSRSEFEITTAVSKIKSYDDFINPNIVKAIIGIDNRALYFTRSPSPFHRDNVDDLSLAYRHVGIYAYRVSALAEFCSYSEAPLESYEKLEQLRALSFGMSIGVCYFNGEIAHGVDTLDDYQSIKRKIEEGK